MDNALTSKIKDYLAQTESERSTVEGATLLLQLNRNKYFFNNAIRNPKREAVRAKIFRELNKWLNIRLDGLTAEQVAAMMPKVEMIGAELEALEPKTTADEEGETSEATDPEPAATTAEEDAAAETAKKIQAARTYISRNVAKLRELRDDETKLVDYTTLKAKVQERYETLKELGAEISDETLTTLSDLGVRL